MVPGDSPELVYPDRVDGFSQHGNHLATERGAEVKLDESAVMGNRIVSLTDDGTLLTQSDKTGDYYVTNAFDPRESLNLSLIFNNLKAERLDLPGAVAIRAAVPYPYNDRRFVVATQRAIYTVDTEKPAIEQITQGANQFFLSGNSLLWSDGEGIHSFNLPLRTSSRIADFTETDVAELTPRNIQTQRDWKIMLAQDGSLWQMGEKFEKLADSVSEVIVSPNGISLAVLNRDNRLTLITKTENLLTVDLPAFDGPITQFEWHQDNSHLIVLAGKKLFLAETTKESPLKILLAEKAEQFFYNQKDEAVYFSNDEGIWKISLI
ncbi:MAG: hypothetical protein A2Y84_02275 [Candidatus Colwellbacteria bacterium RBG_13_48_8]|uniref:Uncharacterized protein n=1 Tax=Candidatus Colwellbacteria bacterium RBG_13_48_8 TaxID=1797685 RepID=A0A1G1YXF1_9BACT|nr:MAG: hypothetical protein A2Y84_02275 [Candidatus Colwellbacteria bacterium RBG_13_48_8]